MELHNLRISPTVVRAMKSSTHRRGALAILSDTAYQNRRAANSFSFGATGIQAGKACLIIWHAGSSGVCDTLTIGAYVGPSSVLCSLWNTLQWASDVYTYPSETMTCHILTRARLRFCVSHCLSHCLRLTDIYSWVTLHCRSQMQS
jgi:hypothetical protein